MSEENKLEISDEAKEHLARYHANMHAVQSGVAMKLTHEGVEENYRGDCSRKHLRVGINAALVDSGALAKTLVEAGVITYENYFKNLADMAEQEKLKYESIITDLYGGTTKITLG